MKTLSDLYMARITLDFEIWQLMWPWFLIIIFGLLLVWVIATQLKRR